MSAHCPPLVPKGIQAYTFTKFTYFTKVIYVGAIVTFAYKSGEIWFNATIIIKAYEHFELKI